MTDGDTIEMHGQRIRIWGVDAVESPQSCLDEQYKPLRCGGFAASFGGFYQPENGAMHRKTQRSQQSTSRDVLG